jgi:hypothetical protein
LRFAKSPVPPKIVKSKGSTGITRETIFTFFLCSSLLVEYHVSANLRAFYCDMS